MERCYQCGKCGNEITLLDPDEMSVRPPICFCGSTMTEAWYHNGKKIQYASLDEAMSSEDHKDEGRKNDSGKLRMDLIPPEVMVALGSVLTMGAAKYDDRNWEKGFAWGRSVAALKRHLTAWEAREDTDPESGFSHLWHVLTNAAFLVAFEARGIGEDDRAKCEKP